MPIFVSMCEYVDAIVSECVCVCVCLFVCLLQYGCLMKISKCVYVWQCVYRQFLCERVYISVCVCVCVCVCVNLLSYICHNNYYRSLNLKIIELIFKVELHIVDETFFGNRCVTWIFYNGITTKILWIKGRPNEFKFGCHGFRNHYVSTLEIIDNREPNSIINDKLRRLMGFTTKKRKPIINIIERTMTLKHRKGSFS